MIDWEKVLKGLECCSVQSVDRDCDVCPIGFGEGCALKLKRDALALLKAQEPKVMTLEEALSAEVNVDQCWLEVKGIRMTYLADAVVCPTKTNIADIQRWGASDCQLPIDLYGIYWRMWTSRPTDEQRKAVKWEP